MEKQSKKFDSLYDLKRMIYLWAESKANLLRKKIEEHHFQHVGKITASFGVTESQPFDDIDKQLCRVDKVLYKSKDSGRNRVNRG